MSARTLVVLLAIGAALAIVSGRLTNEESARAAAQTVACQGVVCEAEIVRSKRTLFGWEIEVDTYDGEPASVVVTCTRRFWVAGDLDCHVSHQDGRAGDRS
jgi:hypothetical protein